MFILIWATTVTVVKHIQTTIKIEDFKSKAILTEDEEFKDVANTRFYKVASNEERPTMFVKNKTLYPGLSGDIIVTLKSGFSDAFVDGFITFYAGGHAAMICDNFYDTTQKVNLDNTKSLYRIFIDIIKISDSIDAATDIFGRNYSIPKEFDVVFNELIRDKGYIYNPIIVDYINKDLKLKETLRKITGSKRDEIYYETISQINKNE